MRMDNQLVRGIGQIFLREELTRLTILNTIKLRMKIKKIPPKANCETLSKFCMVATQRTFCNGREQMREEKEEEPI